MVRKVDLGELGMRKSEIIKQSAPIVAEVIKEVAANWNREAFQSVFGDPNGPPREKHKKRLNP